MVTAIYLVEQLLLYQSWKGREIMKKDIKTLIAAIVFIVLALLNIWVTGIYEIINALFQEFQYVLRYLLSDLLSLFELSIYIIVIVVPVIAAVFAFAGRINKIKKLILVILYSAAMFIYLILSVRWMYLEFIIWETGVPFEAVFRIFILPIIGIVVYNCMMFICLKTDDKNNYNRN